MSDKYVPGKDLGKAGGNCIVYVLILIGAITTLCLIAAYMN